MENNIKPNISIIIPIYNAEKTMFGMVNCLFKQSYQNFEVIFVNDGSTDKSLEICRNLEAKYPNISVYSKKNQGAYSARNLGLQKAKGDYIAFLDADDKIDDDYLEILISACKNSDLSISDVVIEKNNKEIKRFTHSEIKVDSIRAINMLLMRIYVNSGPCGKLFKREIIKNLEFPALRVYEDILFNLYAFNLCKSISITDKTSYHYIQYENSTMGNINKLPSKDIIIASDKILEYLTRSNKFDDQCIYVTVSHLFQYALQLAISNSFVDCEFLKITRKLLKKYMFSILICKAIPRKEKVVFFLFSRGLVFYSRKLKKIRKR